MVILALPYVMEGFMKIRIMNSVISHNCESGEKDFLRFNAFSLYDHTSTLLGSEQKGYEVHNLVKMLYGYHNNALVFLKYIR